MAETGYASLGLAQTAAAGIHTARLAEFAKYGYTISGSSIIPKSLKTGQDDLVAPACSAWDSNPRNSSGTYYVKNKPTLVETAPFDMVNPNRYIVKKSTTSGKTVDVIKYTYPDYVTPTSTTSYAYDEVTRITLSDGTGDTSTSDTIRGFGEDAFIFIDKTEPIDVRQLLIEKGRRVVVLGGHLRATHDGAAGIQGLVYFYNVKDKVHCEGLVIDANDKYGLDCIEYGGNTSANPLRKADHTFINLRTLNANSTSSGLHSDCIQPYGTTRDNVYKNITGTTFYQGMFLDPQADCTSHTLENINLAYTRPSDPDAHGTLLFLRAVLNGAIRPAITLTNVYCDNRDNCPDWATPVALHSGTLTSRSGTTFYDTTKNWEADELAGMYFRTISGTGAGVYKTIISNTANSFTTGTFTIYPEVGTTYVIDNNDQSVIKPNTLDVDTSGNPWGAELSVDGQSVTFPTLSWHPWSGTVYRGKPSGGDYAPANKVGVRYQFPQMVET